MIKKTTVLIFYLTFPVFLFSQQLSKTVLISQGNVEKMESMTLEWTLGDPFVETIIQKDMVYTQGFLQPELIFRTSSFDEKIKFQVSIFPNPFEAYLNIKTTNDVSLEIELFDLNGRSLDPEIMTVKPGNYVLETKNLASGIYMLSIFDTSTSKLELYRVLKK
ncbi:MAG: T9SS type A sorting domain-containing protein [Psychroserpens sp.]|uniref:T9SS type A sorting domain-containing protein n=1 Tax=Psychroserpens sp. TaxID=2020870 RepID=UPI0030034073